MTPMVAPKIAKGKGRGKGSKAKVAQKSVTNVKKTPLERKGGQQTNDEEAIWSLQEAGSSGRR